MVLQRHYGVGSPMAMTFSMRCSLLLRVPCRRGATLGSDDFMYVRLSRVVVVWRGVEFEFTAGLFLVQPGAVESSFEWSCVAALMSQSNRHVLLFYCCTQFGCYFFFLI